MNDIDDNFGWGVVETLVHGEARAEAALQRLGYAPLVVRYNKLIRGAKIALDGSRVRSRADTVQPRPFIPGYLFLPIPYGDDATLVDAALGVRRLFRHRDAEGYLGKPKIIRARIVEQIQQAAVDRDETPTAVRTDLSPGDRVSIPGGIQAVLISLDAKGRASYVADLLGREVRGRIDDTSELVKIAS